MFFVSQHTETLQKPYRKYAKTQKFSYQYPRPFPVRYDSNPHVLLFIIRIVQKDSEDSNTSHDNRQLERLKRNYFKFL